MSTIDIEALMLDIDPDAPCGPNLEYDPAFVALEQEAQGKPEVQYGATITPATPPDWKFVRRMASELLARSRDLRLAMHLLRANLALSGVAGLADGLALIERLLDQRWDSVHPGLDPDDGNDPILRINSLALLADTTTLVRALKDAPLLLLPGLGALTIRLLEVANGEQPPAPGQEKITSASLESALADLDPAAFGAAFDALGRALGGAVNIEVILVRQVGSSQALNLDPLTRPLRKAHEFMARQRPDPAADGGLAPPAGAGADGQAAEAGAVAARGGANGDIASRDDVLRTLERLVRYYRQHEPSSPIPILLERATRLVPMDFLEIMQELAPAGVAEVALIRGRDAARASG